MGIFEDKQKIGLISSELKNRHNVKTKCTYFSAVINGLTQEEKYAVYEDNYYRLQEYKSLEKELGINLETLIKARNGFYAYDEEYDKVIFYEDDLWINIESEMLGGSKLIKTEGNVHYVSHSQCDFKDYGKTWALTREELE